MNKPIIPMKMDYMEGQRISINMECKIQFYRREINFKT